MLTDGLASSQCRHMKTKFRGNFGRAAGGAGAGKIGGILLRAFLEQKLVQPKRVHATVRHSEKARSLAKQLGMRRPPTTARPCVTRTSCCWREAPGVREV